MSRTRSARVRNWQWSSAVAIAAAVIIAALLNILSARHYKRFDWTAGGTYTLSPSTQETLRRLGEPIQIHVLLSSADPVALTIRHLLEAYGSETSQLRVSFVDPDQDPATFLALQQKYRIFAARTEGGQIVSDAAIIVARGDRHHFINSDDLVVVDPGNESRARSRVEQTLTRSIKAVVVGKPPQVCMTFGFGEPSIDAGGTEGLLALRGRLEKNNYQVVTLPPLREVSQTDPIESCHVVVLAAPKQRRNEDEVSRLRQYLTSGGNIFVASGPLPAEVGDGFVDLGLAPLLAAGMLRSNNDLVIERDDERRLATGIGETLVAQAKPHPITAGLVAAGEGISVILTVASSLYPIEPASVKPTPLLSTSDEAFGMVDLYAWAESNQPTLDPRPTDHRGPLNLAYAVELPKVKESAPHGPRLVVLGSTSAVYGVNWQKPQLQGTALFVENSISWLAAQTMVVDVPNKKGKLAAVRITEEMLGAILLKTVILLPLAFMLLGMAIYLRRRATEGRRGKGRRQEA